MPYLRQRSPRSSNAPSFLKARAKAQSPVRQSASPPVRQSASPPVRQSSNFLEPDGGFEIFCNIFLSKLSLASSPQHKHLAAATLPSTSPSRKGLPTWSTPLAWAAAPLLAALLVFAPAPAAARPCFQKQYNSRNLAGCTYINLDKNNLSSLPEGVFDGLSNLTSLHLDDNNLSSLPEGVFDGLSNLEFLWLQRNQLSSLPEGVFDGLSNLDVLYLNNNQLSSLPEGVFDGLSNLTSLHLDYNNLSSLPEGVFDGLSNLYWLRLDDNNLSSLPEGVFDGLSNLHELWLGGNNLSCRPNLPEGVKVYGVSGLPLCDGPGQEEPDQGQQPGDGDGGQTGGGQQPGQEEPDQGQQPGDGDGGQTGGGQQPGQEEPDQGQQPGDGDGGQTGGGQQPGQEEPDQGQQPGQEEPDQGQQPGDGDGGQTGGGQQPGQEEPDQGQQPGQEEEQSFLDKHRDLIEEIRSEADESIRQQRLESFIIDFATPTVKAVITDVVIPTAITAGAGAAISAGGAVGAIAGVAYVGLSVRDAWNTGRTIGGLLSSEELVNDFATALYVHQDALEDGTISLDQAFSGQKFTYPFSLAQGESEEGEDGTSAKRFNALFSGGVNFSRFDDRSADVATDGNSMTYSFGLDVLPNPDVPLVTGLQLAFTRINADFQDVEIDGTGTYGVKLFTVSPTVAWDATDKLTLWSSIGWGRGEMDLTIDTVANLRLDSPESASTTDMGDFFSVGAGANMRVWQSDASALSLQVAGVTASFLGADSKQGRVAAQFSHDSPLNSGRLRSAANLAWLLSDGDPSVMELSGALNWLPDQGRLSGSTSARVLLFGEDRSEWGISGGLTLRPGSKGKGFPWPCNPLSARPTPPLRGWGWTPGTATTTWRTWP